MVKIGINITIDDDDDDGYGYYCDPGKIEYTYMRPRINPRTGYVQYYNFDNPNETICEEDMNDIEHMFDLLLRQEVYLSIHQDSQESLQQGNQ
jgi:hypothetical protein